MKKKLIITLDEEVYEGLRTIIGPRKINRFVKKLVRLFVVRPDLQSAYAHMARDEEREKLALEWAEASFGDLTDEAG